MERLRGRSVSCEALLAEYQAKRESQGVGKAEILRFPRVEDVYNITSPFDGVIAGRVEGRNTEWSKVMFFKEGDHRADWQAPTLNLQDPFFSYHDGEVVIGGVHLAKQQDGESSFRTEFYRGQDIYNLTHLASGPWGEKDIRLVQLADRVGIMRRPQGGIYGNGRMTYQEIPTIEGLDVALNLYRNDSGPLAPQNFQGSEWGGANQLFNLDGDIGVLGHISRRDFSGNRHYYPMAFTMNPKTMTSTPMEILAEAADIPEWKPPKKDDLGDVLFTGGLDRFGNHEADLYVGAKDTYAARIRIGDPFQ